MSVKEENDLKFEFTSLEIKKEVTDDWDQGKELENVHKDIKDESPDIRDDFKPEVKLENIKEEDIKKENSQTITEFEAPYIENVTSSNVCQASEVPVIRDIRVKLRQCDGDLHKSRLMQFQMESEDMRELHADCSKTNKFRRSLKSNLVKKTFSCKACSSSFKTHYSLKKHMLFEHPDIWEPPKTGKMPHEFYECKECSKTFKTSSTLRRHMRLHKNLKDAGEQQLPTVPLKQRPEKHKCTQCGKSSLENHSCHTNESKSKPHKCKKCEATFRTELNLEKHMEHVHFAESETDVSSYDQEESESDDDLYKCKKCNRTFINSSYLEIHTTRFHPGLKKADYLKLSNSESDEHPGEPKEFDLGKRLYDCKECDKTFETPTTLKRHMRYHTTLKEAANAKSDSDTSIDDTSSDGSPLDRCDVCGKNLPNPCPEIEQVQAHFEENPVRCEDCRNRFRYPEKPFKCSVCGEGYINITSLQKHQEALGHKTIEFVGEHIFLCAPYSVTEKSVTNADEGEKPADCAVLITGMKAVQPAEIYSANKIFKCDICGKRYSSKKCFIKHKKKHKKDPHDPSDLAKSGKRRKTSSGIRIYQIKSNTDRKFKCDVCDEFFPRLRRLVQHKQMKHRKDKLNKCDVCGKVYSSLKVLLDHRGIHTSTGIQPYLCNICGKDFLSSSSVWLHKKNKHSSKTEQKSEEKSKTVNKSQNCPKAKVVLGNEKKKRELALCQLCGKTFSSNHSLNVHQSTQHTGEKPHKCKVCGKSFIYSSRLRQHERIHSGAKPHLCQICGLGCSQEGSLKTHLQRIHGIGCKDSEGKLCNENLMKEYSAI